MTSRTNRQRTLWAGNAIKTFCSDTGCDHEDSLGDLLCDLMHWATFENIDFDLALDRARDHFECEVQS